MFLQRDLATFFGELMAANGAVVAPGPAVLGCRLLRNQPDTALLELRCSVEASNCLAFDGVVFRGCCLRVSSALLLPWFGWCSLQETSRAAFANSTNTPAAVTACCHLQDEFQLSS